MSSLVPRVIVTILVGCGIAFLLGAIARSFRHRHHIPHRLRASWFVVGGLMAFFLFGYLVFVSLQWAESAFPLELLVGGIFFGGSLFVWLLTSVSFAALRQLHEQQQVLEERNRQLATEIERRSTAEKRAAARLHYLSSLHSIDMLISASLDLQVTLNVFLEQIVSHLDVDAAAVLLFDRAGHVLEYAAGKGFRTTGVAGRRLRLGAGCAGRAALERRMIHSSALEEAQPCWPQPDLLEQEGFVGYCAQPLIAKGEVRGVLEIYHRKPFHPDPEWSEYLESLAGRAAVAIENAALFNQLQRAHAELVIAYDTTIEGWGRALELRDKETSGHTERVATMTRELAQQFGIEGERLVHVTRGALLHDIGKMAIPDAVLMKEGPLTPEERAVMERHPVYAFEMLSPIPYLQPAIDIPYCHHERWDGSGYPRGLKGEQIPLPARIFAVVDTYDALVNQRRYHDAWPPDKACAHIAKQAGRHFDPAVVEVFLASRWCRGTDASSLEPPKARSRVKA
ncbi:MAG TPA: HD domain-containing protein [Desulfobacterales bacterium]|nr:HD domain-containing protein [Desulfobacterales bacterium]